jgi:hypothetical protein
MFLLSLFFLSFFSFGRADLFDGVWRTYNLALAGNAPPLPLTTSDALSSGWVLGRSNCVTRMGYEYFYEDSAPTKHSPLSIWYTASGNISGLSVYVFGENSAPQYLRDEGYWRVASHLNSSSSMFFISVGFRSGLVCSTSFIPSDLVGDSITINPDTALSLTIPLNEENIYCNSGIQGSAMKCFGTHYYSHLDHNDMWNSSKLVPIGSMYWKGQLTTIMFMSPVPQPGVLSLTDNFWDRPALIPTSMCYNWCDSNCTWPGVDGWSTMHVFFTSAWSTILPEPNEGPPVYRSCLNTDYSC